MEKFKEWLKKKNISELAIIDPKTQKSPKMTELQRKNLGSGKTIKTKEIEEKWKDKNENFADATTAGISGLASGVKQGIASAKQSYKDKYASLKNEKELQQIRQILRNTKNQDLRDTLNNHMMKHHGDRDVNVTGPMGDGEPISFNRKYAQPVGEGEDVDDDDSSYGSKFYAPVPDNSHLGEIGHAVSDNAKKKWGFPVPSWLKTQ